MAKPCEDIQAEMLKISEQRGKYISSQTADGGKPPKASNDPELREFDRQIAEKRKQLSECLRQPTPSVPMIISAKWLACHQRNDDAPPFFPSHDEPYILVFVLNVPSIKFPNQVNLPKPKVLRLDFPSVLEGKFVNAPGNMLWGPDNVALPLDNPDDVIILVKAIEHDQSKQDSVRLLVEDTMIANALLHVTSIGDRAAFVGRMLGAFNGAVATAVLGALLPDDPIGEAQELRYTLTDIGMANQWGEAVKRLSFSGSHAVWEIAFSLRPAR
jgi:hypothetical protein